MNRGELVAEIAKNQGITKVKAEKALESLIQKVGAAMERGERVTISGFGSFRCVNRAAQKGRNPHTGGSMLIPARNVVKFKAGKKLYTKVQ